MLDVIDVHSATQFAWPLPVENVKHEQTCVHAVMRDVLFDESLAHPASSAAIRIQVRIARTIAQHGAGCRG